MKELNTFYVDNNVDSTLSRLKRRESDSTINLAGDSIIALITEQSERKTLLFRPTENNFTYEVNGHFFGTFFYSEDRIVVKWPRRLDHKDHKNIIKEIQHIFRGELS